MTETLTPIQKIEPEFVPNDRVFGLEDEHERNELISLMRGCGVEHVNFCYPLAEDLVRTPRLTVLTLETAKDFFSNGFTVSMCDVRKAKQLRRIKQIGGREMLEMFSHFNGGREHYSKVAAWCALHDLPYVPSVATADEITDCETNEYKIVKAIPWITETGVGLRQYVAQYSGELQFNIAGGIQPIEFDEANRPHSVSQHFIAAAALPNVPLISVTQPTRTCLDKTKAEDSLGKLERYLELIRDES